MTNPKRRTFLKSAGASLLLPTLPSLAGDAATDQPVRRFCCIYFPNGVSLPPKSHPAHQELHWFPHQTGDQYELNQPLEPLAALRDEFTILSGLSHPSTRNMVGHAAGDTFLSGADQSNGYSNSVSIDQAFAAKVGGQTRFPSLTLSSDGGVGSPGRAKTMSFTHSGKPIPSLSSPRQIFNRLFGVDKRTVDQQRRDFGNQRSILDSVTEEARAIESQLSTSDRNRLDEYLQSVREIERRLARADTWLDASKPALDPEAFNLDLMPGDGAEDYLRVILDLMHAALVTDSTRSVTYQVTSEDAKGIGDRFPHALGLKGHHDLSHSTGEENGYENWARYDRFLSEQLAYFLDRLRTTSDPENDGSLLDNTVVLYGCGTSKTHLAQNYPLVLAGASAMGFKHGSFRHLEGSGTAERRMSNLYVTLLRSLGVETERFSDSDGDCDELLT